MDEDKGTYKGKRTRIKEFCNFEDICIRKSPEIVELPTGEFQRSLTIPVIKKGKSASLITTLPHLQRASSEIDLGKSKRKSKTATERSQTIFSPDQQKKSASNKIDSKFGTLIEEEEPRTSHFVNQPPTSSNRSSFSKVSVSFKNLLPEIPHEEDSVLESGQLDGKISSSLPNLQQDVLALEQHSTKNGQNHSNLMRNMLDEKSVNYKSKRRRKKKRPLRDRIQAFYEGISDLIPQQEAKAWYLPPIDV